MAWDLESLRLLGWGLLGTVMIGLALCEGLTLGGLLLLPVLAASDAEKRGLVKIITPASLGNLAWLAAMAAVLFAVWPVAYAVSMASLYWLLWPILLTLLFRPLMLTFLHEVRQAEWRRYGYKVLAATGWIPAAFFGLLVGNLLKGIPFHLDSDMRIVFLGDFAGLWNLFALLAASTCLALLALHGAVFLQLKAAGELRQQAKTMAMRAGLAFLVSFAAAGLWIMHLEGYHINSEVLPDAASNPLAKFVKRGEGLWLDNYEHLPMLWTMPVLAFVGAVAALLLSWRDKAYWAMLASSFCVTMVVLTFGVSMFPFLLPSNISLNSSLTIWDSSASLSVLRTVLSASVFAVPVMAILTRWVFHMFSESRDGNVSGHSEY